MEGIKECQTLNTQTQLFALLYEWETDFGNGTQILGASYDRPLLRQVMKEYVIKVKKDQNLTVSKTRPYTWKTIYDLETEDSIQLTHEPWGMLHSVQNWYWNIVPVSVY